MKIYENNNTIIYKRKLVEFEKPVIVKVLKTVSPIESQLKKFYNEYEFTHKLEAKFIRKAIKKKKINGKHAVILEYFEGNPLANSIDLSNLSFFLKIASNIIDALCEIHKLNIIHKDLNPQNILVNKNGDIKIIDFEISSKYSLRTQNLSNPETLEGTLNYISPEQTGRMNRTLDYRSDFYSLGITFYEILTKQLPFEHTDKMKLVHAHIASIPIAPNIINKKIPLILSNIILKMLSKNAEDRYQSAKGIKYDLQQLLSSAGFENPQDFGIKTK